MKKINLTILSFVFTMLFVNSAQASISVDFGGGFSGVDYNNGIPTPSEVDITFNIINNENTPLTVSDLVISSVSMGFDQVVSGDWSCSYVETHPAPNFERTTTCIPNNNLVVASGDTTSLGLRFIFENTSNTNLTRPEVVELENVVLSGAVVDPVSANLRSINWHITAIDDDDQEESHQDGKVRGYVFFDYNINGEKDDQEEGIEGVKMKLHYAGADGEFDNNDDERYTDKTNEYGKYRFSDLPSGKYRLKIGDGQLEEFRLVSEKDKLNGKTSFTLEEGETKERNFGYSRDDLKYLQSGFSLSWKNLFGFLLGITK